MRVRAGTMACGFGLLRGTKPSRSLRMLRAYIFLAGAGAGAAAAAALVLDLGAAAAMDDDFAGLDAFALAGAFFAVFFGACGGFNVSRRVDGGGGV